MSGGVLGVQSRRFDHRDRSGTRSGRRRGRREREAEGRAATALAVRAFRGLLTTHSDSPVGECFGRDDVVSHRRDGGASFRAAFRADPGGRTHRDLPAEEVQGAAQDRSRLRPPAEGQQPEAFDAVYMDIVALGKEYFFMFNLNGIIRLIRTTSVVELTTYDKLDSTS